MTQTDFETAFQQLTGNPPFPWQAELNARLIRNEMPAACVIPTGLGKTSVIAIWLLARDVNPLLPRRLVYVVNRRTVVDQTTDEVKRYKDVYKQKGRELAVSTLRGQFADNREWSANPSLPAVICGTVDMIGSRLLFCGYGIGSKPRPLHAAFLALDTLIVHDEAHLEDPFQQLLTHIEREQAKFTGTSVALRLRVMALTATPRSITDVLRISDLDRNHKEVKDRLDAPKNLALVPAANDAEVIAKIVDRAIVCQNANRAVLVFVRTIEQVKKIVGALEKKKISADHIAQLTGTIRGLERDRLADPRNPKGSGVFARFLPPLKPDAPEDERWKVIPVEGTVYLICTSAGEVGVNISADDLVCDLSTFESMAQRFGRVNRFGKQPDSTVTVIHPTEFDPKKSIDDRREKTLLLFQKLTSVNPNALDTLNADAKEAAFSPAPTLVPTTDILLDSWSMTSIKQRMPGRPDVEPYLHGISEYEPPETHVAWREEVGAITPDMFDDYPPQDLLELYPLKPHELLRDQSKRVFEELKSLAEQFGDCTVWLVDDFGTVDTKYTLASLTVRDDTPIRRRTVLLPCDVGGLTKQGMLDGSVVLPMHDSNDPYQRMNDVADVIRDKEGNPIRIRVAEKAEAPTRMRLVHTVKWPENEDSETDDDPRKWFWFEAVTPSENSRFSREPVLLDDHTSDVEKELNLILKGLTLELWIVAALKLAAKWHDFGKRRERWQNSIGRPEQFKEKWFAKSGRKWNARREGKYRHEFGSLLDLSNSAEYKRLDVSSQDLVLHLIAAHHGMARPHFEPEQTFDPDHSGESANATSVEVPRRFARLQRHFGHWGLAYLESILRAADWHASENPSKYFTEDAK